MHYLGAWAAAFRRSAQESRSSVASKRFPLSDEWLARFRFVRLFRAWRPRRAGSLRRICGPGDGPRQKKGEGQNADDQPADRTTAGSAEVAQEGPGAAAVAAKARRLHARLHHDPEEAELGAS